MATETSGHFAGRNYVTVDNEDERRWRTTTHGELFSPRALPSLLRAVLANEPPVAPIAIGL